MAGFRAGEHARWPGSLLADYERVVGSRDTAALLCVRGELGEAYLEVGRTAEGIELMKASAAGLAAILGPDLPEVTRLREAIEYADGPARLTHARRPQDAPRFIP